jgi:hypothetical protein
MKQVTKQTGIAIVSLLLALPTAYFFAAIKIGRLSMIPDAIFLYWKLGKKEALGWNINLLILLVHCWHSSYTIFGVEIRLQFTQNHFLFQITVRKRWLPLLVAGFSISVLAILFMYLFGENCNCF